MCSVIDVSSKASTTPQLLKKPHPNETQKLSRLKVHKYLLMTIALTLREDANQPKNATKSIIIE